MGLGGGIRGMGEDAGEAYRKRGQALPVVAGSGPASLYLYAD